MSGKKIPKYETPETKTTIVHDGNRFRELAEKNTSTLNLFDKIERAQKGRRFKKWLKSWWDWILRREPKPEEKPPRRLPFQGL